MQIAQDNTAATPGFGVALSEAAAGGRSVFADYKVIRRNGAVVGFEPSKISVAVTKAFLAVNGAQGASSARIRELVAGLTDTVVGALRALVQAACEGLPETAPEAILEATLRDLYDGVPMEEVRKSAVLAARALIEKDPGYSYVTARLLLHAIRFEVLGDEASHADMAARYATNFPQFIERGIAAELDRKSVV